MPQETIQEGYSSGLAKPGSLSKRRAAFQEYAQFRLSQPSPEVPCFPLISQTATDRAKSLLEYYPLPLATEVEIDMAVRVFKRGTLSPDQMIDYSKTKAQQLRTAVELGEVSDVRALMALLNQIRRRPIPLNHQLLNLATAELHQARKSSDPDARKEYLNNALELQRAVKALHRSRDLPRARFLL